MKKFLAILLAAVMALALVACGDKTPAAPEGGDTEKPGTDVSYESGVVILQNVYDGLAEDQQFPIGGGDSENMTMDAPGAFDIAKTEELVAMLHLPEAQISSVTEAATMMHMMNANTFTSAALKLADGADLTAFADAYKAAIMDQQWLCGMPDTLIIINVGGGYVMTAFGEDEIIQSVKTAALEKLAGSEVIVEEAIRG